MAQNASPHCFAVSIRATTTFAIFYGPILATAKFPGASEELDGLLNFGVHPLSSGTGTRMGSRMGEDRYGVFTVVRIGAIEQKMRLYPPGSFQMGSPDGEEGRWEDEGHGT